MYEVGASASLLDELVSEASHRRLQDEIDKKKEKEELNFIVIITSVATFVVIFVAISILVCIHFMSIRYKKRQRQRKFNEKLSSCLPQVEGSSTVNEFNQKE